MKMIFLWAIFGVVMISCNSSQKNNAPIKNREIKTESQAHTSNLFGTYEGTLPAADCEGIKTILVINEDIIGDSIMELVTPSSGEKTYYRMLNNRQVMLSDKEGTISQSLLAEHYILNKK